MTLCACFGPEKCSNIYCSKAQEYRRKCGIPLGNEYFSVSVYQNGEPVTTISVREFTTLRDRVTELEGALRDIHGWATDPVFVGDGFSPARVERVRERCEQALRGGKEGAPIRDTAKEAQANYDETWRRWFGYGGKEGAK